MNDAVAVLRRNAATAHEYASFTVWAMLLSYAEAAERSDWERLAEARDKLEADAAWYRENAPETTLGKVVVEALDTVLKIYPRRRVKGAAVITAAKAAPVAAEKAAPVMPAKAPPLVAPKAAPVAATKTAPDVPEKAAPPLASRDVKERRRAVKVEREDRIEGANKPSAPRRGHPIPASLPLDEGPASALVEAPGATSSTYASYLRDLVDHLRDASVEAGHDKSIDRASAGYHAGREAAYKEILALMQSQADAFSIPREAIGLGGHDPFNAPADLLKRARG